MITAFETDRKPNKASTKLNYILFSVHGNEHFLLIGGFSPISLFSGDSHLACMHHIISDTICFGSDNECSILMPICLHL